MNMIEKRRRMRGQGGFTLIELLIVIAILGILAGVVVFAVGNVTDNAEVNACKIEKRTVETAAQAWKANNPANNFPVSAVTLSGTGNDQFLKDSNTKYWSGVDTNGNAEPIGTPPSGC